MLTWLQLNLRIKLLNGELRDPRALSDIHGRDHISKAKIGLDKNIKLSLKVETYANMGATYQILEYLFQPTPVPVCLLAVIKFLMLMQM